MRTTDQSYRRSSCRESLWRTRTSNWTVTWCRAQSQSSSAGFSTMSRSERVINFGSLSGMRKVVFRSRACRWRVWAGTSVWERTSMAVTSKRWHSMWTVRELHSKVFSIESFDSKLTSLIFYLAKPVITSDLQNITGLLNQPISLDCQAKGFPAVETKWSGVKENGNLKEILSLRDSSLYGFILKLCPLKYQIFKSTHRTGWCSIWPGRMLASTFAVPGIRMEEQRNRSGWSITVSIRFKQWGKLVTKQVKDVMLFIKNFLVGKL